MYTKIETIAKIVGGCRHYFLTEKTKCVEWRIRQIKGIQSFLKAEKEEIIKCLKTDLNQTEMLAELGEINIIRSVFNK